MKSSILFKGVLIIILTFLFNISFAQQWQYSDQKFSISQFKILQNQKKDGVSGMLITFSCTSTLGKVDFAPNDSGLVDIDYHLYLNILSGNELLFCPEKKPNEMIWQQTTTRYSQHIADQPKRTRNHSFFIANNKLTLGKGSYPLTFRILACDDEQIKIFDTIYSKKTDITLSTLWRNNLEIKDMKVAYRSNWDVAGRNIPFWGFFYGSDSDAGNGYPDVRWKILVGRDVVYDSDVNKDSFSGYDGGTVFNTTTGDEVSLIVYDSDLDVDDFIGSYKLVQSRTKDPVNIEKQDIAFNSVEHATLTYQRSLFPLITRQDISITYDVKKDGVSGIVVSLNYKADHLSAQNSVKVNGWLEAWRMKVDLPWSLYKADNNESFPNDEFYINTSNPEGSLRLFFPYCDLMGNEVINFSFTEVGSGLMLSKTSNAIALERKAIQDASFSPIFAREEIQQNEKGVYIILKQDIPRPYLQKYGGSVRLKTELSILNKELNFKTITIDSAFTKSRHFFIPMDQFSTYTNAVQFADLRVTRNIYLMNNSPGDNSLGRGYEEYHLSIPSLFGVSFYEANVSFRKKPSTNYVFALIHGNDTILMNEAVWKKKNAHFAINTNMTVYHPDDLLQIMLIDPANPNHSISLFTYSGNNLRFNNNKVVKFKKGPIKKASTGFNIRSMNP